MRIAVECALAVLLLSRGAHAAPALRHARPQPVATTSGASRPANVPVITRDNFVSLSMQTAGGLKGSQTIITVQNNGISRESGRPQMGGFGGGIPPQSYVPPPLVPLSINQLNALLHALNQAHFPALTGKYQQPGLMDGINETVFLTISDEQNRDRTFTVENYGDKAPRAYYTFTKFLSDFVALKFPDTTPVPQAAPTASGVPG